MLRSGRLTSQQSSKRHGDVLALRSTTSSSVPHQLNANCPPSWDSAPPLSSPCPRGPCRSISTTNGTRTRTRPGCRAWRHLWLETVVCSWTAWTPREETSQSFNTSSRKRTVNTLPRSLRGLSVCLHWWHQCWAQSCLTKLTVFVHKSSNNENLVLCDPSRDVKSRSWTLQWIFDNGTL